MSPWLIVIIVAVLVIWFLISKKRKLGTKQDLESTERFCKQCQEPVPTDYEKSLCPHCKGFLM